MPSGIVDIQGSFSSGDAVIVQAKEKDEWIEIAKGVTQYGSRDLTKIMGCKSTEIRQILGFYISDEIINRDNLVILDSKKG